MVIPWVRSFGRRRWSAPRITADRSPSGSRASRPPALAIASRLTIHGEPAAQEIRFLVLGLDPVLIFRDQDFQQFMNMENAPVPAKKAYRERGRRATATSELPIGQGITRPRAWSVRLRRSRDRLIGAGGIATA